MYTRIASLLLIVTLFFLPSAALQSRLQKGGLFRWNWRHAHELSSKSDAIGTSKKISDNERSAILAAIVGRFKDEPDVLTRAKRTRVMVVDLNRDGMPDAIAQATDDEICSPTGNCDIWVFQGTAAGYKLILQREAIQTFTIQPSQTSGFFDLVLGMHGSAFERNLFLYRFQDGRYRETACYLAVWPMDQPKAKEPAITPCDQ